MTADDIFIPGNRVALRFGGDPIIADVIGRTDDRVLLRDPDLDMLLSGTVQELSGRCPILLPPHTPWWVKLLDLFRK